MLMYFVRSVGSVGILKYNKMNPKPLKCVICSHEFSMGEMFISYAKKEKIIISQCIDMHDEFLTDKPEKEGGWYILQRDLDGYVVLTENDEVPGPSFNGTDYK